MRPWKPWQDFHRSSLGEMILGCDRTTASTGSQS